MKNNSNSFTSPYFEKPLLVSSSTLSKEDFQLKNNKKSHTNIEVQKGIYAQCFNLSFFKEYNYFEESQFNNNYFVVDFYHNHLVLSQEFRKVFFSSINTNCFGVISAKMLDRAKTKNLRLINNYSIIISRKWLLDNILIDHYNLIKDFSTKKPVLIVVKSDKIIKQLKSEILFHNSNKLHLKTSILQLVEHFFNNLNTKAFHAQETPVYNKNIHPNDLKRLLEVKNKIEKQLYTRTPVTEMAKEANMSISKFKRLFSLYFETTPYQFQLHRKLEASMKNLKQNKCSISEAGYSIGYTNLSHFSKAFKKHFGILPSQVSA